MYDAEKSQPLNKDNTGREDADELRSEELTASTAPYTIRFDLQVVQPGIGIKGYLLNQQW